MMEKLILIALAAIPVIAIIVGFLSGAVANLFGFGFWTPALVCGGIAGAFVAGSVLAGR